MEKVPPYQDIIDKREEFMRSRDYNPYKDKSLFNYFIDEVEEWWDAFWGEYTPSDWEKQADNWFYQQKL